MSKNYAIIIQFVLPLTKFYRSGAQRNNVYKRDACVTSWRFHNRAWQPRRHDRLSETSGILWIHRGALTNQRCSLATGCGITHLFSRYVIITIDIMVDMDIPITWLELTFIFNFYCGFVDLNSSYVIDHDVTDKGCDFLQIILFAKYLIKLQKFNHNKILPMLRHGYSHNMLRVLTMGVITYSCLTTALV